MKEILSKENNSVLIIHYADLLKFICKTYFGWNGQKDEYGRTLLQLVGTDCVRERRPNFWVDFVLALFDLFPKIWDYAIIPDVRFPNEIYNIEDEGYYLCHVHIERPGYDNNLSDEQKKHPSETALDRVKPNYTINNNGSLQDLRDSVQTFANLVLPGYLEQKCSKSAQK